MLKELVIAAGIAFAGGFANADTLKVIDFEDLSTFTTYQIPNGYSGLSWDNAILVPQDGAPWTVGDTAGSGNAAYLGWGGGFSSTFPFKLVSMDWEATLGDNGSRSGCGHVGGECPETTGTVTISGVTEFGELLQAFYPVGTGEGESLPDGPYWMWPYLTKLHISLSFDGPNYPGLFLSVDNIAIVSTVPLPAGALLMGTGLLGMLGFSRKKRIA
ncbi:MAG: VPLPA-CTERM sorting domain-containing protein [Comamonadaceae bacterium]|nr:VPLPA-CTERM sorting domain-containing protein [Burkholderiales bacterium]MEB2349582.1 VPLPA-CTERM sorting domain-containing protein [Comamonadaceae bacterium]